LLLRLTAGGVTAPAEEENLAMAFEWDDIGMIFGLRNHGHLNGCAVRVMATTPNDPLERVHVQLMADADTRVRVKPINLRRIRAPDDLEAVDVKAAMSEADIISCGMFLQVAQHSHKVPGVPGLSIVSLCDRKDEERCNVDAVVDELASAGFGRASNPTATARSPSPVGCRPGQVIRAKSTALRSSPLCHVHNKFEMGVGKPLTSAEKAEALRIGRFGNTTTHMQWGDFCRDVKAARGDVYPSDWHPEIIEGALYKR
jgi:hypothetical protein